MFSWLDFCQKRNIEFVTEGPHTAPRNIYVECPWCRDGKKYMGLHLDSTSWGCWKTSKHAGRKPQRLIRALSGCSWEEADAITLGTGVVRDSWDEMLQLLEPGSAQPDKTPVPTFEIPEEFKPAEDWAVATRYLRKRGFLDPVDVCQLYGLWYATKGDFQNRLILPVRMNGELVGWTGRACYHAKLRYKTEGQVGDLIFNYDGAASYGGQTLIVCEGPLDALKLDYFGHSYQTRAVALMGLRLNAGKQTAISRLAERFERVSILLDAGEQAPALEMHAALSHVHPEIWALPVGAQDPGEMTAEQVHDMVQQHCS